MKKRKISINDFVVFGTLNDNEKRKLLKTHRKDNGGMKKDFKYFAFKSPIGVHSRGLPIDFINKCLPFFNNIDDLYKSIEYAFRVFYGCGIDVIVLKDSNRTPLDDIEVNLNKPTRWSLLQNTKSSHYIYPLDLKPLFT